MIYILLVFILLISQSFGDFMDCMNNCVGGQDYSTCQSFCSNIATV